MDLREIAAVFVDGEQAQPRLADEGDVVAGGGRFGDEGDEYRSGAGDGDGGSAGQSSAWEQSGERWGNGHGPEGFAAYSGGERFRVVVDDGRDPVEGFDPIGWGDGGQVGGCVVAAATGDGGHPATEDVELGSLVESGEVFDRVDGGHGIDLSPCRWELPPEYRTGVRLSNALVRQFSGVGGGHRGRPR
jgi:hypothetical protein